MSHALAEPGPPPARGRAVLRWGLKIALTVLLMAFLLRRISLAELEALLRGMDRVLLAGAVAVFFISNVAGWLQWHVLLRAGGVSLSRRATFRFYFVGLFFNNFLPANIGGDVVKVLDVTRLGADPYRVIAVTLLDRLLGVFSLCLLAAFADLVLIAKTPAPYIAYLLIFIACMIPAVGFYFFRPLGNALRRGVVKLHLFGINRRASSVLNHLSPFKGQRQLVAKLVGFSMVIQALRVVTHVLVGMALGIHVDAMVLCQFFVFIPLLSLAMIPPITINGLGIREGLGIVLFAAAGIGRTDAFAMEFLTFVVSVAVSLVGLVFFLSRRGRFRA
ncbi:MAG TPA: lysylphosphatidylglycerol synthase transmembrane domain-containing protein [Candidatus Krumholzibacteria bacterium]|nr:lysylphosphatidylglycerol synthase transmembrane domain-containing protein [Candidatus Krumholzibacteria bacterium]